VHPRERLMLWLAGVLAISLLRVVFAVWARRSSPVSYNRLPNTPSLCLLVGLLAGGVWGVAATWLFPLGYSELYFVTAFLLIGMPAGAISSFGAWWPAYAAYVLASVGPFAVYFLMADRSEFMFAGLAACLFGAFLLREGFVMGRTIQRNIAQRIALMEMTRSLGEALDNADEASRAKSTFLTNMSHELRTPLNVIIGMSELLAEAPDAPAHRHLPDSIRRASRALHAQISDILDLSQIEAGRIALRPVIFAPLQLVEDILDIFEQEAAAKSLRLETRCARELPERFIGDPARLRQILVNLVANAIKFTPAGGVCIEVDCAAVGGLITLSIDVVDDGPGVPVADRERIFNAFQQIDGSASRTHAGSGLGLKISRDLAQLMGGTLDMVATDRGGSRFRLRVPQADLRDARSIETHANIGAAEEPAMPSVAFVASRPLEVSQQASGNAVSAALGLRVLVVEDNTLNSELMKLMLERDGCEVRCIANGVDALEAMGRSDWDIVLMDCQMPAMDGYATTRHWREIEAATNGRRRLPIVALTAHAMAGDREKCLAAGMDDYLTKPVILDDLRALLARHGRAAMAAQEDMPS
jgi:signal transduction histidine kinase/ActR/RegA family two-component response regulator